MDDLLKQVAEINNRLDALQKERVELEASALAHEQQARADRLRMSENKKESQQLQAILHNTQVQSRVASAEAAANKAKAEAEELARRAAADAQQAKEDAKQAKEAQDAMLAKLKAQSEELEALIAKANAPSN